MQMKGGWRERVAETGEMGKRMWMGAGLVFRKRVKERTARTWWARWKGEVCGCARETKRKAGPHNHKRDYRGYGPIILRIPRPSMQSHRGHPPRPHFRAGSGGIRRRVMTKTSPGQR